MKNYKVRSGEISHLVKVSADLFEKMREETKSPNDNPINLRGEATKMYFVVDLLKQLVEIVHPGEESPKKDLPKDMLDSMVYGLDRVIGEGITVKTALDLDFKSFEEALQKVSKIAKEYKPISPMDIHMELLNKMFGGDK